MDIMFCSIKVVYSAPLAHSLLPAHISPHVIESGFWNPANFCCGIGNPRLWKPEYSSRNLASKNRSLRSRPKKERERERKTHVFPARALVLSCTHYFQAGYKNYESSTSRGIQNPGLFWIPLHEVTYVEVVFGCSHPPSLQELRDLL